MPRRRGTGGSLLSGGGGDDEPLIESLAGRVNGFNQGGAKNGPSIDLFAARLFTLCHMLGAQFSPNTFLQSHICGGLNG